MSNFRTTAAKSPGIVPITESLYNLRGVDMGMGITMFQLIRTSVDMDKFDASVRKAVSAPITRTMRTRSAALLNQLHQPLSKMEKEIAYNSLFGLKGKRDFLELVVNDKQSDMFLAIKSGCSYLSNKIMSGPGTLQEKAEDFMILSKLTKENRALLLSRILENYIDDDRVEEFCYCSLTWRFNSLDLSRQCAYLGCLRCKRGRYFPFLAGMSHGIYLVENDGVYEREGLVPISRMRRPPPGDLLQMPLSAVKKETKGIYCVRNMERIRFLDNMYEPLTDALPNLEWAPHRKYAPIYNFRLFDTKR